MSCSQSCMPNYHTTIMPFKVTQTNNCWKLEQTTLDQINIKIETTSIENDINYRWQKALMKRVFALTFIKLL